MEKINHFHFTRRGGKFTTPPLPGRKKLKIGIIRRRSLGSRVINLIVPRSC
jgi:hypothetical protein